MDFLDCTKNGIALARQGRLAEAIASFRQAVQLNPNDPEAHYNLGTALKNHGQFSQAALSLRDALRLNPIHVNALNNLGIVYKELDKLEEALECYGQVLRLEPAHANAHNNRGNVFNQQGQKAEAQSAYEQAIRLNPNRADFHYNLGSCLYDRGELDQAVACYRRALQLLPGYADASNNLGKIFKEQGLLDEAIAQFKHALKAQPNHPFAIYNLSELVATGHYRFTADELAGVQAALASGTGSPLDRSQLSFTLATVHHQQKSYDLAFGFYRQANDLKKKCLPVGSPAFDAKKHQHLVDRVIQTFDRSYFQRVQGWGLETSTPVFIVGMPRSGSTLVEQILASHPQAFGAGEIGEITRFVPRLRNLKATELYTGPLLADKSAAAEIATTYLRCLTCLGREAARVTNKSLDNFLHLGLIATLFPQARIIHCRREVRDLCLSCYFQNFQDVNFSCSLDDIGAYYRSYETLMKHWAEVFPLPIHEVNYENLVHDQEGVTRDLLAFCGLDWDDHCLTFFNTKRVVRTASAIQVRKPISTQAIGRWKLYRSHLEPLFQALGMPSSLAAQAPIVDYDAHREGSFTSR